MPIAAREPGPFPVTCLLRRLNQILTALALGVGLLALGDAALYRVPAPPPPQPYAVPDGDVQKPAETRPFSHYAARMDRPLFSGERRSVGTMSAAAPAGALTLEGEASHLEVQGIFMDEAPQALVTDRRSRRSYILREGQFIGPVQVREIRKNELILFYQGRTLKLSL